MPEQLLPDGEVRCVILRRFVARLLKAQSVLGSEDTHPILLSGWGYYYNRLRTPLDLACHRAQRLLSLPESAVHIRSKLCSGHAFAAWPCSVCQDVPGPSLDCICNTIGCCQTILSLIKSLLKISLLAHIIILTDIMVNNADFVAFLQEITVLRFLENKTSDCSQFLTKLSPIQSV